jgi:hypothetical protein
LVNFDHNYLSCVLQDEGDVPMSRFLAMMLLASALFVVGCKKKADTAEPAAQPTSAPAEEAASQPAQ